MLRASTADLSRAQLAKPYSRATASCALARVARRKRPGCGGRGVARLRGAQQVAGFVRRWSRLGGPKIGHDVSFTGLRSARQADKGDRR